MITLIGMGSGTPESLTAQGLAALQNAGLILGAKRLLEQLPQGCTEHRKALYQPDQEERRQEPEHRDFRSCRCQRK